MTNGNDGAFAHEGSQILVHTDLHKKYPDSDKEIRVISHRYSGLSKREYFAAMALNAFISNAKDGPINVRAAVRIADMLIDELNEVVEGKK